jgi:hypothetical protein
MNIHSGKNVLRKIHVSGGINVGVVLAIVLVALAVWLSLGGWQQIQGWLHIAPKIGFANYGNDRLSLPDFARVEHDYPLTPDELARLTPENLKSFKQEEVDQIYARLTSGPIPDGAYDGGLFFPKGASEKRRIAEIIGGLPGLAANLQGAKVELLGKTLWKGKVFYRDERLLRNRIEDLAALKPIIDGDLTTIPKITVHGKDQWLMFPARLYCGQSLLDSRRESVIIDYAFTDEIEGYRERPDYLAGRNGFQVRDEIRMVRPGFYLGRAYLGKIFLLNFTLYNENVAGQKIVASDIAKSAPSADCWGGTQQRAMTASR